MPETKSPPGDGEPAAWVRRALERYDQFVAAHAPTEGPRRDARIRPFPKSLRELPAISAAAVSVAVLFYLVIRLGTAKFYAAAGVRVEDLETGYPDLLEQGAAYVAVGVATSLEGVAIAMGGAWGVDQAAEWCERRRLARRTAVLRSVAVGLCLVGVVTAFFVPVAGTIPAFTCATAVAFWSWAPTRSMLAFALLGVVCAAAWSAVEVLGTATEDALEVRRGKVPTTGLVRGVSLVPWSAVVAKVQWVSGSRPTGTTLECVLVLGTTRDGTVIYSAERTGVRHTLVLRPEQAIVLTLPDARECRWPQPRKP